MLNPNHKSPSIVGGILLIIGNIIGAGILALPIALAHLGLPYTILILLFFWLLMMLGAYYMLEANLALAPGSNLISMSQVTLGKGGVIIAWVCHLLVMYSLISAYISGGSDLVKVNFYYIGVSLPTWASSISFLFLFGFIVSLGIHITNHTNQILMIIKGVAFFAILIGLSGNINLDIISMIPQKNLSVPLLMIVLTSFGFATLIPSLRSYYKSDIKKIRKIIFLGTFIPFICYAAWIILIFSVVPYFGNYGLDQISASVNPVSDLQSVLNNALNIQWITQSINIFSAICIITSFLANSISLTDFIADGLNSHKSNKKSWIVYFVAFFPPLCAVLFYQKSFLMGLYIAGTLAIIQLLMLPGGMVWILRNSNKKVTLNYSVFGGNPLLISLLTISLILLLFSVSSKIFL